jgi:hypothetical protein
MHIASIFATSGGPTKFGMVRFFTALQASHFNVRGRYPPSEAGSAATVCTRGGTSCRDMNCAECSSSGALLLQLKRFRRTNQVKVLVKVARVSCRRRMRRTICVSYVARSPIESPGVDARSRESMLAAVCLLARADAALGSHRIRDASPHQGHCVS